MTVIPAGARLAVVDPPVDPPTGLILPPGVEDVEKGIVVELGDDVSIPVQKGDLVFYHKGHYVKIDDAKIIGADCVIAFDDSHRST